MNVYAFIRSVPYRLVRDGRILDEQEIFYHGLATRNGLSQGSVYVLGFKLEHPLEIIRSGVDVPAVFMPVDWGGLVVREDIRAALIRCPKIDFLKVRFDVLNHFEAKKGDSRITARFDRGEGPCAADLLYTYANDPTLHNGVSNYYEVICAYYNGLRSELVNGIAWLPKFCSRTSVPEIIDDEIVREREVLLSPELFDKYALFHHGLTYFCREDVFEILAPHMDWDYFQYRKKRI